MTKCSKIVLDIVFFFGEQGDKSYILTIQSVLGGNKYKNNVKIAKGIGKHVFFMHASIFVINHLNKSKFFLLLCHHSMIFLYIIRSY